MSILKKQKVRQSKTKEKKLISLEIGKNIEQVLKNWIISKDSKFEPIDIQNSNTKNYLDLYSFFNKFDNIEDMENVDTDKLLDDPKKERMHYYRSDIIRTGIYCKYCNEPYVITTEANVRSMDEGASTVTKCTSCRIIQDVHF
uniref:TFIIS-type domain-containing protein n=1 Tax=Pithovirus LCDPAC02 TaxID=2506601 RepID=A0A481YRD4_9VIRU|nr:MAG: hypothetical protein LCDPAC02_02150 [Pithovirus LCDPAC02]